MLVFLSKLRFPPPDPKRGVLKATLPPVLLFAAIAAAVTEAAVGDELLRRSCCKAYS